MPLIPVDPKLDRRRFLSLWNSAPSAATGQAPRAPLTSGLEPFQPDAKHPWDAIRAGHLLRRTMMMPVWEDITRLVAVTPGQAVELVLSGTSSPSVPSVANSQTESLDGLDVVSRGIVEGQWKSDAAALRGWWTGVQKDAKLSIVEKMTLFWSGHFTTKFVEEGNYVVAPLLYRQNKLFRDHALGNFKDLVSSVTLDGAMLVFLGGNTNSKGAPNENYARELMELYTTGLGWYTEGDVQNAARILTGWRIARYTDQPAPNGMFNTYFDPNAHDTGAKIFMNTSFPARDGSTNTEYIVRKDEIQKLIDVLFVEREQAIAKYLCRKLYRFFVYSDPASTDEAIVAAMADLLIQNNFEVKPVLATLLKSAHFFDTANIGAQIKTPAEYTIGIARQLWPAVTIDGTMSQLGQELFEPPNVSGWPGYHDWITTNTYPIRGTVAQNAIGALDDTAAIAFISQFTTPSDVHILVKEIAQLLMPRPLSASREANFVQKLTGGAPDYEWPGILSNSPATAARNLRDLLTLIVSMPDFELC